MVARLAASTVAGVAKVQQRDLLTGERGPNGLWRAHRVGILVRRHRDGNERWVAPAARGQGLARRLMAEAETFARSIGMTHLRLDTNSALTEAIALYRKTGWEPTAPFTRAFPATDWFLKRL